MKTRIDKGDIRIGLDEIMQDMSADDKKKFLESFVFEEVMTHIERQLKHETDSYSWDTLGYNDGGRLREAILKIQGIEPEFEKDLRSRIRALEGEVLNYKKYYEWYWKLFHLKSPYANEETIIDYAETKIGKP